MSRVNPIVCGRTHCVGCGRWRLIIDFSCSLREPFKLQARCRACAARALRERLAQDPEKAARSDRARRRRYEAKLREDPVRLGAVRERRRVAWRRARNDPERWAVRLANARINHAERTARRELRRRFMVMLLVGLREELERRERAARAERERKRAYHRAWIDARRARFLAGEVEDPEPVFKVNGNGGPPELVRLPSGPLARWLDAQERSTEALAIAAGINPRSLRRYVTGESMMVGLEIVDVLTTRLDVCLHEIYDPGRWPSLYEVAPTV